MATDLRQATESEALRAMEIAGVLTEDWGLVEALVTGRAVALHVARRAERRILGELLPLAERRSYVVDVQAGTAQHQGTAWDVMARSEREAKHYQRLLETAGLPA